MTAVDQEKPEISLFYPMYNEEKNIERAVHRAHKVLGSVASAYEIIIVNDGSADRTGEIAERLARESDRVRVVTHERNLGYGAALRSGIGAARLPLIFYTDGDNQFDLGELPGLLPLLEGAEIVTGYRVNRKDGLMRLINARIFNVASGILFGIHLKDIDCAFKLYKKEIFSRMRLFSMGAIIDLEILAKAKSLGYTIREIGVSHFPRQQGSQTGANLSVVLKAMLEILRLRFDLWFRKKLHYVHD
jgi:glycosyltransferase involved in cell wall biosynthesis